MLLGFRSPVPNRHMAVAPCLRARSKICTRNMVPAAVTVNRENSQVAANTEPRKPGQATRELPINRFPCLGSLANQHTVPTLCDVFSRFYRKFHPLQTIISHVHSLLLFKKIRCLDPPNSLINVEGSLFPVGQLCE